MGQDINALGSLGAVESRSTTKLYLSADQQQAQTGAYEPYGRLITIWQCINWSSWWGCWWTVSRSPSQSSPFQTALGTAMGLGGLYGKIFNN